MTCSRFNIYLSLAPLSGCSIGLVKTKAKVHTKVYTLFVTFHNYSSVVIVIIPIAIIIVTTMCFVLQNY